MRAAFYKGTHAGIAGLYNRLVRWWTRGPYSHVELVFDDGICASSSFIDGGVRFKRIELDPANWTIIELPQGLEDDARNWFNRHLNQGYDLLGNLHFLFSPIPDTKSRWFCSEAIAAALGLDDPWRFDPNTLHAVLHVTTVIESIPDPV